MNGRDNAPAVPEPFAVYLHHLGGTCRYFRSDADARAFALVRGGEVAETSPGIVWRVWDRTP